MIDPYFVMVIFCLTPLAFCLLSFYCVLLLSSSLYTICVLIFWNCDHFLIEPNQLFRGLDRVGDGEVTVEDFELVMDSAGTLYMM